ncbi:MAG: NRDE family protein [Casimicrobiaceae bacterium]
MCLAVVALEAHPRYALVVAANRDEYHARATAPARWWTSRAGTAVLAGRDLAAGGTWLGMTRRGRWAFVTNVREPGRHEPQAPSRGALVVRVLDDRRDAALALSDAQRVAGYNGFNLIAGDVASASWGSNRVAGTLALPSGIHGVSNARLDTPWPKLERVKAGVAAWAREGHDDVTALLDLLADRERAPDDALPATGVTLEWERLLSAPFIVSEGYGTRCSTVLAVARDGAAIFHERSYDATGAPTGDAVEKFALDVIAPAAAALR